MARIRTIKPEITQSPSFNRLSREARLFFVLLYTIVDDSGRARGSSRILASLLYPEDRDVDDKIDGWIDELARQRMGARYKVADDEYMVICNWLKHQKIDHPTASKLPPPPESLANPREEPRLDQDQYRDRKGEERSPAPGAARPAPKNGHKVEFNFEKGKFVGITEEDELRWQKAYPAIAVPVEVDKAAAWMKANPANKKRNYERFLVNWFGRAQERAPRVQAR
jgi:hypothetical protein